MFELSMQNLFFQVRRDLESDIGVRILIWVLMGFVLASNHTAKRDNEKQERRKHMQILLNCTLLSVMNPIKDLFLTQLKFYIVCSYLDLFV